MEFGGSSYRRRKWQINLALYVEFSDRYCSKRGDKVLESNRNDEKKNNKLVLSQIGDIAGRGNFILAFHQRLARRRKKSSFYTLCPFLLPSYIHAEVHCFTE